MAILARALTLAADDVATTGRTRRLAEQSFIGVLCGLMHCGVSFERAKTYALKAMPSNADREVLYYCGLYSG